MSASEPTPAAHRAGPLFWITAGAGWAVIAFGVRGLFHHHIDTRPANLARFVVSGLVLHDLIFAPLVLAAGVVVARTVPGRVRAPVQAALFISGSLALFSYPLVRGYGHAVHNPSSLPHDYAANLALVLGLVWAGATVAVLLRLRRRDH